ncbi:hypothetical protein IWW37_002917 [Coemansia sp. RSA 2050]|nr:hypothetical protein IWW37_002917 [Coemansia sp. RSA 2050]KAJ2731850.1 hypothetical protein IW152_004241 [Coemansia sp. BCRC 34962]
MTNTVTPPNTRSNIASQQPTTTDKIKDSVKQAVNKAQNVLTGSSTKTMTPPSSNDAAHVLGTADNKTNVGVHGTEAPRRTEGAANKATIGAGNVERNDAPAFCGIRNDIGATDNRGALGAGQESRANQQTGTVPKQTNLAPSPPSQKLDNTPLGRYQYDPLDRLAGSTAGQELGKNERLGNDETTRTGNQGQLGSNSVAGGGRQGSNVYPPQQQGSKVTDDLEAEKPSRLAGATIDKAFDRTERRASDSANNAPRATRAGIQGQLGSDLGGGQGNTDKGSTANRAGETKRS